MSIKVLALLLVHASGYVWEWCLSVDLKHVHTFPFSLGWALSPRPACLFPGSPPGLKPGSVHSPWNSIQGTLSIAWCVRGRVLHLRPPLPRLTIPLGLAGQARESTTWRAPAATSFLEECIARVTGGSSTTPVTGDSGKPTLCVFPSSLFSPPGWNLGPDTGKARRMELLERCLYTPGTQLAVHTQCCPPACPISLPGQQRDEDKSCHLTDCPHLP